MIVSQVRISIHALLAESDCMGVTVLGIQHNFYPRSPCGERPWKLTVYPMTYGFLSTLSLRRATQNCCPYLSSFTHFYPRSPCGERPYLEESESEPQSISIHALLAESDFHGPVNIQRPTAFLSTLSLRRATNCTSIGRPKRLYFYPRSPCGERLFIVV